VARVRKVVPLDVEYLSAVEGGLSEWNCAEESRRAVICNRLPAPAKCSSSSSPWTTGWWGEPWAGCRQGMNPQYRPGSQMPFFPRY